MPVDDATPVRDLGAIVPMLADVPQIAAPTDFTQRVDFSTLIEKPDLTAAKVFTIPEGMRRVGKLTDLVGPIFNSNNLGGYLAFNLYPDVRIFQDSRFQSYPPEHFRSILRASDDPQKWTALVAGVDWAVLSRPRPDALSGVGRFPPAEWTTVFRDEAIEIVRRANSRRSSIAR